MTIYDIWKKIEAAGGPTAVLLNKEGETKILPIALAQNPDLRWDLIYIRSDGWSLGCEFYLGQYAEHLHRDQWVGIVRRGDKQPKPLHFAVDKPADAGV